MRAGEAGKPRNQPQRGEGIGRSERKGLASALCAQPAGGAAHGGKDLRRSGVELLAGFGQGERAVPAVKERRAELVLEVLDLPADGRLREEKLFPRLGERQVPRGG